jgi:DNA polymerase V
MRIPASMSADVQAFVQQGKPLLPLYGHSVQAGFPSPAEDDVETHLNLHDYVVHHPAATFFLRAKGQSMREAGIHDGDLLVVDRSLEPANGRIVIAAVDGELTVKRLYKKGNSVVLQAENPDYPDINIPAESELHIWGVVTNVLHQV